MFSQLKQLGLRMSPGMVIRYFARPYIAGFGMESALEAARRLYTERGILATIDLLGEEATDDSMASTARSTYLKVAAALGEDQTYPDAAARPSISVKPSAFCVAGPSENESALVLDQVALVDTLEEVIQGAAASGVEVTIDMEDHRWTTPTLEVYRALLDRGHATLGTVLQSRLFRTPDDIEALPEGCRIRMVIGVYLEPAEIAFTDKREMKEKLLAQCGRLFERGCKVELATHDEQVLERFFRDIVLPRKIPTDRYEVQMLLGVPRDRVIGAMIDGSFCDVGEPVPVRLYVPFALSARDGTAYCRRRLIENPDMVSYGLINMVKRG